MVQSLDPCAHTQHSEETLGPQLRISPAEATAAIWGVKQQQEAQLGPEPGTPRLDIGILSGILSAVPNIMWTLFKL